MLETGIVAQIKVCAVDTDRMQSLDSIREIKLCDRLPESRSPVRVCDNLVFEEIRLGAAVDPVTLKIIFLVECIEGELGPVIPIQGDSAIACDNLDNRFLG